MKTKLDPTRDHPLTQGVNNMKIASLNINNFWEIKALIQAIEDNFTDFIFDFRTTGVFGYGLDKSNISLMEFVLTPEYFIEYECFKPMRLCIDTEELLKSIKRIKKISKVSMEVYEEDIFLNVSRGQNLQLHSTASKCEFDTPKKPSLEFPPGLIVNTNEFSRLITDLNDLTERAEFKLWNNDLLIRNDHIEGKIIGRRKPVTCEIQKYSLRKLSFYHKAKEFGKKTEIQFKTNSPLSLTLRSSRPGGLLNFLLAPVFEKGNNTPGNGCGDCKGEEEKVCSGCTGSK